MANANKTKLDKLDIKILNILQRDGRITNAQLAAQVGISAPAMSERVKRLEKSKVIKKYVALLDSQKIGKGTMAIVSVSLAMHQLSSIDQFTREINNLDEILESYHITGEDDFLLKIVIKDIKEYESFVLNKLTQIKGVRRINTSFVLSEMKYSTQIHLQDDENL